MKRLILLSGFMAGTLLLAAQSSAGFWQPLPAPTDLTPGQEVVFPTTFRSLSLAYGDLVNYLRQAPATPGGTTLQLELPTPDGGWESFQVWDSPVMEAGLAARFPQIRTYGGRSSASGATLRLACTTLGLNAIVHGREGVWFVSTQSTADNTRYMSYRLADAHPADAAAADFCGLHTAGTDESLAEDPSLGSFFRAGDPVNLHTYRLAVATTAEYSNNAGGTVANVLSSVTNVVNQVNSIFERDGGIRLVLIDNTTETFFFNAGTDPYTNGNTQNMLQQNLDVLNAAYTNNGYDIGHVFGTNGGGLAALASVCSGGLDSGHKSRGASCRFGPYMGNLFYLIVGHEVGHQFNATHTFNKCDDENETPATAYEPGSGSSIMSYNGNGVCGPNHLQATSDPYFHINSMERIRAFSRNLNTGGTCATIVSTGNHDPDAVIPIPGGFSIPIGTPFELTGSATDMDGDDLSYSWEQYDLGPPVVLGSTAGTAPLFRSFPPSGSPLRVFPRMATIVANTNDPQELLPSLSRVLTFRFTARDNHPAGGGYDFQEIQFNASSQAGPFVVTQPDAAGIQWEVGQYVEVTWDVAQTDQAPVNCQSVNIRLSLDGGFTYPLTLLSQTPNDGSAFVVVPNTPGTMARIRVEAADNIFFDISNQDFTILPPAQPGFSLLSSPEEGSVCTPEPFVITLQTDSLLGFSNPVTFSVTGLPAGATASFSENPVLPGSTTTLTILTDQVTDHGVFDVQILAEAADASPATRQASLFFISSDFSALAPLSPADGASGLSGLPDFSWTDLPNATLYDIQIATDPGFSDIVDEAYGIVSADYTPALTLSDNTVYYWRLRASNSCTQGVFQDPASFHTIAQTCRTIVRPDTVWQISSAGLPYLQDKIDIQESGIISDINVRNIKGSHDAVGDMAFRLKNPAGDSVTLLSSPPCNSSAFNLGFDDQSPLTSIPCPPNTGLQYRPQQELAAFNGGNVEGTWTLVVAIVNTLGSGGAFNGWALEYCASLLPKDPYLVKNDTLAVPPGDTRLIYKDHLVVEDEDNLPSELTFTVVTNTQAGTLLLNGQPLGTGGQFTMLDVYSSSLQYANTDPAAPADYFTFGVSDGNGGYFGTPRFHIRMDPNAAPSSTNNPGVPRPLTVYPNPTAGAVTLSWGEPLPTEGILTVSDLQGRRLRQVLVPATASQWPFLPEDLATGLYLVRLQSGHQVRTGKLLLKQSF
ncbi:MAG: hypothetical protein RLY31_1954 [Bacteroidota bacterium]|jgi:hypothetical protein